VGDLELLGRGDAEIVFDARDVLLNRTLNLKVAWSGVAGM